MIKYGSVAALLCAVALTSCGKNAVQDITEPVVPGARIKFFNFAVGTTVPGVNFYADATKMTAISSTTGVESTTGTASGGVGNGGFYSAIDPGTYTFAGKIAATVDKDLAIATLPATVIADGKFYSLYLSGTYNTTSKSSEIFIVEDPVPPTIDFTQAYVRFVNTISNSTPQTLYVTPAPPGAEIAIGGAVAYKSGGAFIAIPAGVYDLNTRTTGSSANAISRTGVSFSAGRVYTIASRGDMTIVSTTDARRPQLDNTTNR
jgi:hypothetical protein